MKQLMYFWVGCGLTTVDRMLEFEGRPAFGEVMGAWGTQRPSPVGATCSFQALRGSSSRRTRMKRVRTSQPANTVRSGRYVPTANHSHLAMPFHASPSSVGYSRLCLVLVRLKRRRNP